MSSVVGEMILVVEDNEALRAGLVLNLEHRGYRVESAADGGEGLRMALDTRPDLIVLDIMLPGKTGLDILSELRRRRRDVPVLILSARDRTEDKVEGLNIGADDYLAKPFDLAELLARVEAMLRRRRSGRGKDTPVSFGRLALHRERRQLFLDGREIELSVKEFGILCLLAQTPGRPFSREEIIDRVWGWDFEGSPRTIDNFIMSLRQKVEDDSADPRHILTVRGVGYKLVE